MQRWLKLAKEKIAFQGLPARICWLGQGEREKAGLAFNELVRTKKVSAPIVIGRDHLDTGSVASPNRETEAMLDGSDAVADWPILNALVNTAGGASWVSLHHGGGVGMGYSIHAGMVIVADGSDAAAADFPGYCEMIRAWCYPPRGCRLCTCTKNKRRFSTLMSTKLLTHIRQLINIRGRRVPIIWKGNG